MECTEMESKVSSVHQSLDIHMSGCFVPAMDVSADLTELGRTPVTVVSAGVKSILDIPRTLEVLVSCLSSFCTFCMHHILFTGNSRCDGNHLRRF